MSKLSTEEVCSSEKKMPQAVGFIKKSSEPGTAHRSGRVCVTGGVLKPFIEAQLDGTCEQIASDVQGKQEAGNQNRNWGRASGREIGD
jgi:hypothetical protein